jgi:hypothetical protein
MPRRGEWIRMPDGGVAHLYSETRRKRCVHCHDRWSTTLCDYPDPSRKSGTCDRPLCRQCAVPMGPNLDYCPHHPRVSGGSDA